MIELKMLTTEDDLQKVTGLTHDELWEHGFNLDDWDVCFASDVPLMKTVETKDGCIWDEPTKDAWWLVMRMDNYCVGCENVEYNGKHYYMVYHS